MKITGYEAAAVEIVITHLKKKQIYYNNNNFFLVKKILYIKKEISSVYFLFVLNSKLPKRKKME